MHANCLLKGHDTILEEENENVLQCVHMCVRHGDWQREMSWNSNWNLPLGTNEGLFITSTVTSQSGRNHHQAHCVHGCWRQEARGVLWMGRYVWPHILYECLLLWSLYPSQQNWRDCQRVFLCVAFDLKEVLYKSTASFYVVTLNPCCRSTSNTFISLLFCVYVENNLKMQERLFVHSERNQKLEKSKSKWKPCRM